MSGTMRLTGVLSGLMTAKSMGKSTLVLLKSLPKTNFQQSASMLSVAKMEKKEKIPPFPYKKRKYTKLHLQLPFLDITQMRMDCNSKIVTVESNIAAGKAEFAKQIADKFGMLYMPEPTLEDLYINDSGFDYRTLNQYIHPKLAALDEKMFYENPTHPAVGWYKVFWYRIRFAQYIDALAHLFNTGQGVVLERSPQSDFVFADAMVKNGHIPEDAYDFYYRLRWDTIHYLPRPHLIIYLDADTDLLHKRIMDKNISYIKNSKVMTKKYLQDIDNSYKEKYLEDSNKYSEVVIYKWNEPTDLDDIVLDIEKLQMDDWDCKLLKFKDWNLYSNELWDKRRYVYTRDKSDLLDNFNMTMFYDCDSINVDWNDYKHRDQVYDSFVNNYGVLPELDQNKVGWIRSLLGWSHWKREEEFAIREPFY